MSGTRTAHCFPKFWKKCDCIKCRYRYYLFHSGKIRTDWEYFQNFLTSSGHEAPANSPNFSYSDVQYKLVNPKQAPLSDDILDAVARNHTHLQHPLGPCQTTIGSDKFQSGSMENQCKLITMKDLLNSDDEYDTLFPEYDLDSATTKRPTVCTCNLLPKNPLTSVFIVLSLLYGMLLIVGCIGLTFSQEITHSIPSIFYEGYSTFLFGGSIIALVYLYFFVLSGSSCCDCKKEEPKPKPDKSKARTASAAGTSQAQGLRPKPANASQGQERIQETSFDLPDVEAQSPMEKKRKATQYDHRYGSFFLRVGVIAFGIGTMIYCGLQFGQTFEYSFQSECYDRFKGINMVLQMVFTFMLMYFIFTNARLKIHGFKFIARFGLMHIMATCICLWIKIGVTEFLRQSRKDPKMYFGFSKSVVNSLTNEYDMIEQGIYSTSEPDLKPTKLYRIFPKNTNTFYEQIKSNVRHIPHALLESTKPTTTTATKVHLTTYDTTSTKPASSVATQLINIMTSVAGNATTIAYDGIMKTTQAVVNLPTTTMETIMDTKSFVGNFTVGDATKLTTSLMDLLPEPAHLMRKKVVNQSVELITRGGQSCNRMNIMGTIVEDSAPFLYPFVVEFCLIGAAVIYIIWRHIGRVPRYLSEEDFNDHISVIYSQRAIIANRPSRMACLGSSKGLFFGLLVLVGSLICLILFFVLIHHSQFSYLAIYLADASHSVIMCLTIFATLIGYVRAKILKYHPAESTDLNDILLRISAFFLFVYEAFSIIAGASRFLQHEKYILVTATGIISIVQVVLQLIYIGDMSKRRVMTADEEKNKPGRQIVTFLLISNITMWIIFTFESQKVLANPIQLEFYGYSAWLLVEYVTLPLCIFHRFHSAVTLAEIWKSAYKLRLK